MGSILKEHQKKIWPILPYDRIDSFSSTRYDILTNLNNPNISADRPETISYKKITRYLEEEVADTYNEFVYDWRKNNLDHLEDFYNILSEVADEIIIVAHSMGGLISKLMLNKYAGSEKVQKVTKLITLGTPWKGSIDAYKTLIFGKQVPDFIPFALFKEEAKKIVKYFPSVYQLLPSNEYFSLAKDSVGNKCSCFVIKSKEYENFEDFFTELLKLDFEEYNHEYLSVFGDFNELLSRELPEYIQHHEIIGVGKNTMSAMNIDTLNDATAERYDGDGTVPLFSAMSETPYKYFVNKADHVKLTKIKAVHEAIKSIVMDNDVEENEEVFKSLESPYYKKFNGKVIKVACPVEVAVLNNDGDAIYGSLDSIDEEVYDFAKSTENITYEELGSTRYIILDEDIVTDASVQDVDLIRIQATDTGPTSVTLESYESGKLEVKKSFRTFEITPNKEVILNLEDDIQDSNLEIVYEDGTKVQIESVVIRDIETVLPNTSLKICNENHVILSKENLRTLNVVESELVIEIESIEQGTQEIDQTFIKYGEKIFIINGDNRIQINIEEGFNEITYFSKDIAGNFEEEKKIYVYRSPKNIYELKLEFLPHQYIADLKFNMGYDQILYEYGKLEEANLKWEISGEVNTLGNWILYSSQEKIIKISYTDVFSRDIEREYTIDENIILSIMEGTIEEGNFQQLLNQLNVPNVRVTMKIDSNNRVRKINNDNLRNASQITFTDQELEFILRKSTKYELCWKNLTEEVDLQSTQELDLDFTLLDKEHKEVKNVGLKYHISYDLNNEKKYSDDFEISYNQEKGVYELEISLEDLASNGLEIDTFEINVYETENGNSIRVQKIIIRK